MVDATWYFAPHAHCTATFVGWGEGTLNFWPQVGQLTSLPYK